MRVFEQYDKQLDFKRWASGNLKFWPGALFHGGFGGGKTSLSIWMAMNRQPRTKAKFAVISDVVRSVKETWGELATRQESEVLDDWLKWDLLIIDEVGGVQFGSLAERNVIYDVVVKRLNRCRPTIMTTNCNLKTDAGRDEFYNCAGARIADRFQEQITDAWEWGPSLRKNASRQKDAV